MLPLRRNHWKFSKYTRRRATEVGTFFSADIYVNHIPADARKIFARDRKSYTTKLGETMEQFIE